MALETSALLAPEVGDDQASVDDTWSRFTLELRVTKGFIRKRFWWFCVLGIAAIVTLQLSFLPRTSPSRDFRRWNSLFFTRSDVKRIFLVQLEIGVPGPDGKSVEQNLMAWIKQLSAINGRSTHVNVASDPSEPSELASFIESLMRSMHFATSVHTYPIRETLKVPLALSLQLVNTKSSRVLYTADLSEAGSKTPAYFLFGKNGTLSANYVFCNAGDPLDFWHLQDKSVVLKNKIAVFSHTLNSEYALEDKIEIAEAAGCLGVVVFGDKDMDTAISRNYKPQVPPVEKFRLPVSYKAIQPVLQTLKPAYGEFPTWSFGPTSTDSSLELVLTSDFAETPLNAMNIIASIDGILNDGEIVVGASRDVLTSANPLSGHAIMLEVMKRLSLLQKKGWKPLRRIRFVSWDASRSGALGSAQNINDNGAFPANMPVLAYINLDEDVVTGSHFTVDSSPLFNHVLKNTADLIPFPKNSTYYKRLLKDSPGEPSGQEGGSEGLKKDQSTFSNEEITHGNNEDYDDSEGLKKGQTTLSKDQKAHGANEDYDENEVSFLRYWLKQDQAHINNHLGHTFAGKDSGTFQLKLDTPVVSFKFHPSPKYNDSLYVAESEAYSAKWVTEELDPTLDLHALLVRFLGLFVISLSEHEVVDSRTRPYVSKVQEYLADMKRANENHIEKWTNETVSYKFFKKTELFFDIQQEKSLWDERVLFGDILAQLDQLIGKAVEQAHIFDRYTQNVENLWTTDYPWYKMIRKVHIYAKFKLTNYKLLRVEKELGQAVDWLDDPAEDRTDGQVAREEFDNMQEHLATRLPDQLTGPGCCVPGYHHFMYDVPSGIRSVRDNHKRGAFAAFYEAFDALSMERVVKLAAAKYERLKVACKRIT